MPAGKPWVQRAPSLRILPVGFRCWHVYPERYGPLSANRNSEARLALLGSHGMFYTSTDLAGVLWETVLRWVEPDEDRHVRVDVSKLSGVRAIELELTQPGVPVLELGQPGLKALFPKPDCAESIAVAALIAEADHKNTHAEARQLEQDLAAVGVEMPVVSWPSRQHHPSTVYLAYEPPMGATWWNPVGTPIALDDPGAGHALVRATLLASDFHWVPLATSATPP